LTPTCLGLHIQVIVTHARPNGLERVGSILEHRKEKMKPETTSKVSTVGTSAIQIHRKNNRIRPQP
jgi:hypothetical protein